MASSSNNKILRRCPQISSFSSGWSNLPPDLLQSIASALQSLADYIRFRSVCRSWNAAVEIIPRELPWLMLPFTSSSDKQHRCFFNPFTNTHHRLFLPEVSPRHRIIGSSPSGYWVITDGYPELIAINPLTREKFPLPPLTSFPKVDRFDGVLLTKLYTVKYFEILKTSYYTLEQMRDTFFTNVILTRDSHHPSKFLAFATPNAFLDLAYCKQGDVLWRSVYGTREYHKAAIWFRGKLYLVDRCGSLAICKFSHHQDDSQPVVEFIKAAQDKVFREFVMVYLVDVMGELLMVRKYDEPREGKFDVFKFDWSAKEWRAMASLENQILFLSPQYSFAVSSDSYPGWGKESIVWFKSDYCVKKTDSCKGYFEAVIFKMSGGLIKYVAPFYNGKLLYPIWFAPRIDLPISIADFFSGLLK